MLLFLLWTLLAGYESNPDLLNDNVRVCRVHVNYMVQTHRRCSLWMVVRFNRLINLLQHERNHWIRNRANSSHLPTPVNLPKICLTVVLKISSLFPNRYSFENYLWISHFYSPHFQPVLDPTFSTLISNKLPKKTVGFTLRGTLYSRLPSSAWVQYFQIFLMLAIYGLHWK